MDEVACAVLFLLAAAAVVVMVVVWVVRRAQAVRRVEARLNEVAAALDARLRHLEARFADRPAGAPGTAGDLLAAPHAPAPAATVPAAAPEDALAEAPGAAAWTATGPSGAAEIPAAESMVSETPAPETPVPEPAAPGPPIPATAAAPASPAPSAWASLEEKLGARLPVWLGAIALALAAAFLVKYSADQGWIGPPVRVGLGVAFGLALEAAAHWLRRRADRIAAGLAAAGVAALYASFLAAVHLYELLPPLAGFVLMALTTAAAVALSLVHGPIVAVVGMAGGFLTPAWIQVGEPRPLPLFTYLALLQAGVLAVSRRRSWPLLGGVSFAAGVVWALAFLFGSADPGEGRWVQLFMLVSLVLWGATRLSAAQVAAEEGRAPRGGAAVLRAIAFHAAVFTTLVVFAAVLAVEDFGLAEWGLVAVLLAGLLAVARLRPGLHGLAWLGSGMVAALLLAWAFAATEAAVPWFSVGGSQGGPGRFLWVVAGLGVLSAGGAYAALWGSERPASWGALAAAAGVAHPLVAWLGVRTLPAALPLPWPAVALLLAGVFVAAAVPVARRRRDDGDGTAGSTVGSMDGALAALATAATVFVSWAAGLGLERESLTVAWALEVPALVWLAGRFRLPVLLRLSALLAGLATLRLLMVGSMLEPWTAGVARDALFPGTLLVTYGLAVVALVAAVALAEAGKARALTEAATLATGLRWAALLLSAVWVAVEAHRVFTLWRHPVLGAPSPGGYELHEAAAVGVGWMLLAAALLAACRWRPSWFDNAGSTGSRILFSLGLLTVLAAPGLLLNPAWQADDVGALPVVNQLLWIYGGPALLAALALRLLTRRQGAETVAESSTEAVTGAGTAGRDRLLALAWAVGALLLLFVFVTLEVRQAFRGPYLVGAGSAAERWAVSAAWLLLGTALLVAGIAARGRLLRAASLAVMGLTVVKVFLLDVARLGDLYRVLSFLGLGLSLLLLAWLYQRYVFGRAPAPD